MALQDPKSSAAEAFRALRTNVQFAAGGDRALKSLLVTSAGPAEGKTLTAANLAVSLAQDGKRVILVDTDLRRPNLHRLFGLPNKRGFSNLMISNPGHVEEYVQGTEVEGLRVLTSGPLPPDPAELLGSRRAEQVLEELEAAADVVIFDSPPAVAVTDAVILAARAAEVHRGSPSPAGRARPPATRTGRR